MRANRPGDPLQPPPEEFSTWDDLKYTLGGFFLLLLPIILIALLGLAIWGLAGD